MRRFSNRRKQKMINYVPSIIWSRHKPLLVSNFWKLFQFFMFRVCETTIPESYGYAGYIEKYSCINWKAQIQNKRFVWFFIFFISCFYFFVRASTQQLMHWPTCICVLASHHFCTLRRTDMDYVFFFFSINFAQKPKVQAKLYANTHSGTKFYDGWIINRSLAIFIYLF